MITAAIRPSRHGEDHLGRVRIAVTFKLPSPPPATIERPRAPSRADQTTGRSAARLLAVTGPLDLNTLLGAVDRRRRWRRAPMNPERLVIALTALDATETPDGRWCAPPRQRAPERYHRIVAAAAGREFTRAEVMGVLEAAGYAHTSADGVLPSVHPLLVRTGPDRCRVLAASSDPD